MKDTMRSPWYMKAQTWAIFVGLTAFLYVVVQDSIAATQDDVAVKGTSVAESSADNITLNFQDIETRALLQLMAKTSGLNFVISDKVVGKMSLHLEQVPWQEALDIILKANGLGYRRVGNSMLIAPVVDLASNERLELQAAQKLMELAPLVSSMVKLKYANATDIAKLLKGNDSSLLSARGQVGVDSRTNSLWVRDNEANLKEVRHFVRRLDVPARQVMIEARIVSIDKNYDSDIGAAFGITRGDHLRGTLPGDPDPATPPSNRLNFNLPATPTGTAKPGSIALSVLSVGGKTFLDLELSALERDRRAETISSPRLITSNQQPAHIEQGEEIPYLTSTSSGATSIEFKKAVLSMDIIPQITPDDNIVLTVRVTQNTRGEQIRLTAEGGSTPLLPPSINTKVVESQVFLRNGETVVIGGIYQKNTSNEIRRVPFFGDLPVVGIFFRNNSERWEQRELFIFVTPRIIDQNPVV